MQRLLAVGLIGILACGGGRVGDTCRVHDDCADGLGCQGPNDPGVCGIPPREACADHAQCASQGGWCHAIADPCSVDGIGSECGVACTGPECGAGFRCDGGACVAVLCDAGAGVTCPAHEVCDPSRIAATAPVHARTHGCFPVTCTSDDACGEQFCVNGICQVDPGLCREPVAVP